jgi:hypothetical protein
MRHRHFGASRAPRSPANLSWTAATDDSWSGIAHYEIWYGVNSADVIVRGGTAIEWDNADDANLLTRTTATTTITGLTSNTNYYYKIWAIDAYGNGAVTADNYDLSAWTIADPVSGVSVADASSKIDYQLSLSWTDPLQVASGLKWNRTPVANGYETSACDNVSSLPITIIGQRFDRQYLLSI